MRSAETLGCVTARFIVSLWLPAWAFEWLANFDEKTSNVGCGFAGFWCGELGYRVAINDFWLFPVE